MGKALREMHDKHKLITTFVSFAVVALVFAYMYTGEKQKRKDVESEVKVLTIEKKEALDNVSKLEGKLKSAGDMLEESEGNLKESQQELKDSKQSIEKLKSEVQKLSQAKKESKNVAKGNKSEMSKKSSQGAVGSFVVTHYTAYCNGCTGVTTTGVNVRSTIYHQGYRVIAVDPTVIPLGSIVRINDSGNTYEAIALDTGGAIKGSKLDLLVGSKREAYSLGVKTVSVDMIRRGWG